MARRAAYLRAFAIAGVVLVWLPFLAMLLTSVPRLFTGRALRVDFLIPAELFPLVLVGGIVLLVVALLARQLRGLIGGILAGALVALASSQGVAVITGLASGRTAAVGWPWITVLALLGLYIALVIALGIAGIALARRCGESVGS